MREHNIESNWRIRPIRSPKVLKGHDDHVITCLQFSNNRIVSGSDDNTLKVMKYVQNELSKPRLIKDNTPVTYYVPYIVFILLIYSRYGMRSQGAA